VKLVQRKRGQRMLTVEGRRDERATMPQSWTDQEPDPMAHRLALDGLVALNTLVKALKRRCGEPGAGEMVSEESPGGTDDGAAGVDDRRSTTRRADHGSGEHGRLGDGGRP
jgi:hypothetical protein